MNELNQTAHIVNVPTAPHWSAELSAVADLPRPEFVKQVKALRKREFDAIADKTLENINEVSGLDVCTWLTSLTDAIIVCLARRAFFTAGATAQTYDKHLAVCAVGGYGRGEMNPYSDLDLLILVPDGKQPDWVAAGNQELQTLCWDVGFQVGASMRSIGELERIIKDDYVTATAVIEGRHVDGGALITEQMDVMLDGWRKRRGKDFLKYKMTELAERRGKTGASLFLMEPNIKSNPGGLRDTQLLQNIAFIVYGGRNLLSLEQLDVITREDLYTTIEANDHLLLIRSLNHFHHGRKHDIWQLPDQLRIAEQLGYSDVSRMRAVEHLMKRHYALVNHVHHLVELTASRLQALGYLGRRPLLILSRRVIDNDFTAIENRIYLSKRNEFWVSDNPGKRLLLMCRTAQVRDMRISLELQRDIRNNLQVITDEVRNDPDVGRAFLAILGDVGRVRTILSDMHDCSLLGSYVPEFENIAYLMQFNSYHQYTVDEHTLIAIGHFDVFEREGGEALPGMNFIWAKIRRKDLLNLGLLLHDVGKYMGRGHVSRGAMMVGPVAKRLGLTPDEEDLVYFLVERHVSLSDASRMRDFTEEAFISSFTDKMGTAERLDYLYCLTYADAKAVGEGILTGWQGALLYELRAAVLEELDSRKGEARPARRLRIRAELVASGRDEAKVQAWLEDLPHNYQYQTQAGEGGTHLTALEACQKDGLGMDHDMREDHARLVLALPDRDGLFGDVTAALTGNTFDIIEVRTWVTKSHLVLYHFRLTSPAMSRLMEKRPWANLRGDLLNIQAGTFNASEALGRRKIGYGEQRPADSVFDDPAVKIDSKTSGRYTILDIHAKDEVGLLSRMCRSMTEYGVNIRYACINTMGDVAVDVFYVIRNGEKLTAEDANGLREHLIEALSLRS